MLAHRVWPLLLTLSFSLLLLSGCKKGDEEEGRTGAEVQAQGEEETPPQDEGKKRSHKKGARKKKKGDRGKAKAGGKAKGEPDEQSTSSPVQRVDNEVLAAASGRTARRTGQENPAAPTQLPRPAGATAAREDVPRTPPAPELPAGSDRLVREKKAGQASPGALSKGFAPPPVKVSVARLITVADLNSQLAEKGWIAYGPIQGIPPSEYYNSLLYRRPGTNRFVSLLVWDYEQYTQALDKWRELLDTYPNAETLEGMFAKFLFFSYRNQVSTLTVLEPSTAMVLSVSCHSEACDDTALYELVRTAAGRAEQKE